MLRSSPSGVIQKISMATRKLIPYCLQAVLLIGVTALLSACSRNGANTGPAVKVGSSDKPGEHLYSTTFPLTENPLSEGGAWLEGSDGGSSIWAGHLRYGWRLWGDVETSQGIAHGVDEPTEFGDPTAILTGTWGPTQTATATVRVSKLPTGHCCHEVELRLRTTITSKSITGYEAYCSVMPDNQYCHIARWNGPNGSYWNFEAQTSQHIPGRWRCHHCHCNRHKSYRDHALQKSPANSGSKRRWRSRGRIWSLRTMDFRKSWHWFLRQLRSQLEGLWLVFFQRNRQEPVIPRD